MVKLFYKDKPLIGLDISQTGIKVMALDAKNWEVHGYGAVDLNPAKVQAALETKDNTYLSENIKSLLTDRLVGSLPSNHTAISIPTSRTFLRTFTLPIKEERNIESAVSVEVNQYIPVPISSLYVDYEVADRTKDEITVVLVAVPKTLVDNATAAAWSAGLRPILIEPSICSVARIIGDVENGQYVSLIVDIGPSSTDIAVIENGTIRVSGGIAIGGNTFTVELSKKLKVTLENAHQLKVITGLTPGPRRKTMLAALDPSLQRILTEIRKVIRYYHERMSEDHKIEQVVIVGGGSNIPGMGEYFTEQLVMAARVATPWQQLKFGNLPEPNKQFRPRYITVAGLAMMDKEAIWND